LQLLFPFAWIFVPSFRSANYWLPAQDLWLNCFKISILKYCIFVLRLISLGSSFWVSIWCWWVNWWIWWWVFHFRIWVLCLWDLFFFLQRLIYLTLTVTIVSSSKTHSFDITVIKDCIWESWCKDMEFLHYLYHCSIGGGDILVYVQYNWEERQIIYLRFWW
jgi:hypothetical protein